ncbi:Pheromone B alpha 3 receptor [Grifola frondosa]|uniref:Pheromone B alpha 3 receptor n=1 Tax=Grifola frondosa TaxID=5627 RepID=A0A1C7MDV7_GRIFR|nr:Pheromone B alpha 3 receptor [Grifola frondosa]
MSDPTYPLFPVFAFLAFILTLVPLPWHLQAWNSATCFYMFWASIASLNEFVNSVVWAGNALNPTPIWCDISTRIMIGASVGIPAASLCINRRLYIIACVQTATITRPEKLRAVLIDSLICLLFPILVIALSYIVQGHRFNIFEDIGCFPAIYNTLLAYFLVYWWPLVLGLISAVYCILSIRSFLKRRVQFNQLLASKQSSLTIGRYFRLMALATTELLLTVPISTYAIYLNATAQPVGPWRSWADTHFAFARVDQIPDLIWRMDHDIVVAQELGRWLSPVCGLIFFAYFGFASEARRHYRLAFWAVARHFGLQPAASKRPLAGSSFGSFDSSAKSPSGCPLPPYVPRTPTLVGADYHKNGEEPVSPNVSNISPTDSAFSNDYSIAYIDIEMTYGARIPSFVSLEVDGSVSSEPPSPVIHHDGDHAGRI